jgi:hypothetical protein
VTVKYVAFWDVTRATRNNIPEEGILHNFIYGKLFLGNLISILFTVFEAKVGTETEGSTVPAMYKDCSDRSRLLYVGRPQNMPYFTKVLTFT